MRQKGEKREGRGRIGRDIHPPSPYKFALHESIAFVKRGREEEEKREEEGRDMKEKEERLRRE